IQYVILAAIVAIGIALRWVSADFQVLLGADPWWFYRHAQMIYDNNFQIPQWDIQSHFPPGRPVNDQQGWPYTLAIFYAMLHLPDLSLMKFTGFFVPVFASLSAIPAYFVGRILTNRLGALVTAFLAVITPRFISVSVAGYPDSDSVVVFYTFLAVLTTLYAINKADKLKLESYRSYKEVIRYLPYLIPALIAYWVFAVNWSYSWYIYFIFLLFIPLLVLFRFIEGKVFHREGGYLSLLHQKVRETKSIVIPIVLIGFFGQILSSFTSGWPYNTVTPDQQLIWGLIFLNESFVGSAIFISVFVSVGAILGASFGRLKGLIAGIAVSSVIAWLLFSGGITGHRLLVFDSIAELTPLDFTAPGGFASIMQRVGNLPALFGMIGLIGIFLFKLFTKREIRTTEFFALFWIIASLSLILAGERFSLLFGIAVAV
ncbi:MAG: STT3 domain-containing protein, partial [Nitrososphaerales archaeon]